MSGPKKQKLNISEVIFLKRKIVIVGGVAGGASAAAKLRRNSEEDEIIMLEKGPYVSFSNCSLPYHLSGIVEHAEDLVLMTPERFQKQYHIDARANSEVISLDREERYVLVKNLENGETYKETYDKLILSPGASPIVPELPGMEKVNLFTVRNVGDIDKLNQFVQQLDEKTVAVIGGGFIGVEVAENLNLAGNQVTMIEGTDQVLRPYDYDMVQIFHKEITDHGVNLIVEEIVTGFEENTVVLASGKKIHANAVVMAIGIAPETRLAKLAGLELGPTRAIKTNQNFQTNDPDIYAVGDAVEVYHALTHLYTKLSLAGPALKQARSVANHINDQPSPSKGYIGTSAIKVFDFNGAATGLNESMIKAQKLNINYEMVRIILSDKVGLMLDAEPMHFKMLFEVPTGKILGAQAIGKGDVTKRIDVIATVIKFGGTVEDLKDLELSYAPPFSTAKDIVNYAGYVGSNLLNGFFRQVNVNQVRELKESGKYILDVRERVEYEGGHIKGAVNIPLSELRERMSEIPNDQPVYVHCRTGQRSYNAVLALQNAGFKNVSNITGSFLGLSLYEAFNDQRLKRDSIVTDYNFD
jgi:NADPH-dependent 2,4-dienoyl-CoA reductase/sulfur reductase-like enzyme/rhodanese-related sulfurtransferase